MADVSDFVTLNVGGVKFVTTKTTLLMKGSSQPSSFFSGLVSEDFSSPKDHEGAYLVDRNPDVFRVILECLRTGSLYLPKTMSLEQVIEECEYYCLDTLIATLKEKLEEEKNPQVERLLPPKLPTKPRLDGVYEGNESIIFIDHERFIMSKVSKGPRAGISVWNPTAAVLVFANCFPLPQIWIDSARAMHFGATDTQMAALATETVIRGKYSVDETGKMTLLVGQNSTRFGFLSQNHQLVTFDIQNSLYSEETFTFCAFTR